MKAPRPGHRLPISPSTALGAALALAAGCAAPGADAADPTAADPTALSARSATAAQLRVDQRELTRHGVPYLLRGDLGRVAAPIPATARTLSAAPLPDDPGAPAAASSAQATLAALAPALPGIAAALGVPAAELRPIASSRDEIGMTHVRLAQHKDGLRVMGGEVILHIGADGAIRAVTSTARDRDLAATPALSAQDATRLALADTAALAAAASPAAASPAAAPAVAAAPPALGYAIAASDGELHLAWQVRVVSLPGAPLLDDLVLVDALTGAVVDRYPQIFPSRARTILDGQNQAYPPVSPAQIGAEGSPPTDPIGVAAYDNTGGTYDCYKTLFQRDSYDNLGSPLNSVVHVVFPDGGGGTDPNNAVWVQTARQMAYGDGDGVFMAELARAFDVTAHELTHGVTAATANLQYRGESGALNEAMSDIMGAVCESWQAGAITANTWQVGEDIFTPATAGDALRYMNNPTLDASLYPPSLGGSRDYYPEAYTGASDNGGVHLNSGIPNLTFYLLVAGGPHPRSKTALTVPSIGMDKARRIFYRALTQGYFTFNTEFLSARSITELVANELYGAETKTAVATAWAAVGVGSPPPSDVVPPLVEIVSPADGAHVMPGFQVQINASDDKGVTRVDLLLDGMTVGSLTAPPYTFTITSQLAARNYVLSAVARDAFNQASDSATVTVELPACTDPSCDPGAGDDDGGGCCSVGDRGGPSRAVGSLVLTLALALALGRRRRPRRARPRE